MARQISMSAETLWSHLFAEDEGWLVAFSGKQRPGGTNELQAIKQLSFRHPVDASAAADHLRAEAGAGRDSYFGVHLYAQGGGVRRRTHAAEKVRALWLDEDEGRYPDDAPGAGIVLFSSSARRHLYWPLAEPVSAKDAVSLNKRIALLAGGDVGKAALSTVLRVPETFNYKRLPQVDPVRAYLTGAGAWEPEVLDAALPPLPKPEEPRRGDRRPYAGTPGSPGAGEKLDLAEFLSSSGVAILGEIPDTTAERVFRVVCPWAREHTGGDRSGTRAGQYADGALFFHCEHSHCGGRGWAEFRNEVDPRIPATAKRCKARRVWRRSA